jgi:hypothetical protein
MTLWGKIVNACVAVVLICCVVPVILAAPQACEREPSVHTANSTVTALGFLRGRISNLTYGHDDFGDYIEFHAQHVFYLALAPYGCSIVWLFLNRNVHMHLDSSPVGYAGARSIHIIFKTIVSGPI